jgi:hypothetical protein
MDDYVSHGSCYSMWRNQAPDDTKPVRSCPMDEQDTIPDTQDNKGYVLKTKVKTEAILSGGSLFKFIKCIYFQACCVISQLTLDAIRPPKSL